MSSASNFPTAAASRSFTIRGQSFSIFVSSASIAALSGVGCGVAAATMLVLPLLFCELAQPIDMNAAALINKPIGK